MKIILRLNRNTLFGSGFVQNIKTDTIICPCLGISESQIVDAQTYGGCQNLADIKAQTEAGTGCMSCHVRIRALLAKASETVSDFALSGD